MYRESNPMNVENAKRRIPRLNPSAPVSKPPARKLGTPLDAEDLELVDAISARLESLGGGKWFRNAVIKQSLRVLAGEIGVDAPPPILPASPRA